MRLLLLIAVLLTFAACDKGEEFPIVDLPPTTPPTTSTVPITVPNGFVAEVYADGFLLPTSLAFPPDGSNRLFVNELQTGRIRIIEDGVLRTAPFATVITNVTGGFPVNGENGLLGIAFHPDFADNGYVYVSYVRREANGAFGAVARYTEVEGRGTDFTVLVDGIPAAEGHQIESLAFGPDGKLYVSVGDAYNTAAVQSEHSLLGKVLRMNDDGSIPADNPTPGSYVYATGLRNAYDLAFAPDGTLYTADNGPDHNDELNRVAAGGNLGWPTYLGPGNDAAYDDPLYTWPEIVSPNGMAFYQGTAFPPAYRGKLFIVYFGGTFSNGPSDVAKRIQMVDVTQTPPVFQDFAVYNFPGTGNPLDVAEGPDGSLYVTDIFQERIFRIRYVD